MIHTISYFSEKHAIDVIRRDSGLPLDELRSCGVGGREAGAILSATQAGYDDTARLHPPLHLNGVDSLDKHHAQKFLIHP